jgi:hypothetical protein
MSAVLLFLLIVSVGYTLKKNSRFKLRFNAASIFNDAGERIQTLDFSVPVLRAAVLDYAAGELQSANPELSQKAVRLYYPPDEVSKKDFLDSIQKAPVSVGSHEKNTSEHNVSIDGWPVKVYYDAKRQAAIMDGVVKGASKADYVRQLQNAENFGASGFIDAREIEIISGVTPTGEPYDAIARKLHCTHVALLPNVRDPANKIETRNARAFVFNAGNITNNEKGFTDSTTNAEAQASNKNAGGKSNMADEKEKGADDLRNAIRNVLDDMEKEKAGSAKMSELEKTVNALRNELDTLKNGGKNAETTEPEKKPGEAANSEHTEPDGDEAPAETLNTKNAKPSQDTIKAFADHFGIDFGRTTPSFNALASLAGVKAEAFGDMVVAVNAKAKEIKGSAGAAITNSQAATDASGFDAFLKGV